MNQKRLLLLCAILVMCLLTSCGKKEPVEYYCTQRITEYTFDGKQDTSRVEMEYDEQWRLVSQLTYSDEVFYHGLYYEYNAEGTAVSVTQNYEGEETVTTLQRTYDNHDNLIKELTLEDVEVVSSDEYTYDDQGRILVHVETPNDSVVLTNTYSYDDLGNKVTYEKKTEYTRSGDAFLILTEYGYDDKGHLAWEKTYVNDSLGESREYQYDEETNTENGILLNPDGTINSRTRRIFDKAGNVLVQEMLKADGTLLTRMIQSWMGTDGSISKWDK